MQQNPNSVILWGPPEHHVKSGNIILMGIWLGPTESASNHRKTRMWNIRWGFYCITMSRSGKIFKFITLGVALSIYLMA
jgi:hypothetical protein